MALEKQLLQALKPFAEFADALDEDGPPWVCGEGVVGGCGKTNVKPYCDCSSQVQNSDYIIDVGGFRVVRYVWYSHCVKARKVMKLLEKSHGKSKEANQVR